MVRSASRLLRVCLAFGTAAAIGAACGCAARGPERPPASPAQGQARIPSYEELARRYNERIAALPRLWARTTGRIWFPDDEGHIRTEQVEGHLQFLAPGRLLLNFDKVGQTYGLMGANDRQYWWIQLDREPRAFIGEHARVTADRIEELGMPVYPRDVIDLVGLTRLPPPEETLHASVAPSADGRALIVVVELRAAAGSGPAAPLSSVRRMLIDPATFEPVRIEILTTDHKPRVVSTLANYQVVSIPGAGPEVHRPRVATEVSVATADQRTTMRLRMSEPEIGRRRPSEAVFDVENLVRHYGVTDVVSLDDPRAAAR